MTDGSFQIGDKVVVKRERRMRLTVADVGENKGTATLYLCSVDEEHAAGHGRGRSTRWFREDDLIAA